MKLNVEIKCKETIKPSSSIPDHLPTYNLNVLDQFVLCARNMHVPILLFYDTINPLNQTQTSFLLKNSLQETLTHFYPLAGRVKGHSYIDCNDAGATYIETSVAENMKEIVRQPKLDKLRQLLPINPYECSHGVSVPELVLIQVNHFSCGGLAIGVCASHTITDAATLGTFVKTWVAIASGSVCDVKGLITDTTSIFPPVADSETAFFSSLNERFVQDSLLGIATNRFVFDAAKIAALKTKIGSLSMPGFEPDLPTKFEALCALILGVLMHITDEKRNDYVAMVMLNLRKRMNPPLPPQCIGNVFQGTHVMPLSNESEIRLTDLAHKIRDSVRNTNDENVRMFYAAGGCRNEVMNDNIFTYLNIFGIALATIKMGCLRLWVGGHYV